MPVEMGKSEVENHAWVPVGEEAKQEGERCMRSSPSDCRDSKNLKKLRSFSARAVLETHFCIPKSLSSLFINLPRINRMFLIAFCLKFPPSIPASIPTSIVIQCVQPNVSLIGPTPR